MTVFHKRLASVLAAFLLFFSVFLAEDVSSAVLGYGQLKAVIGSVTVTPAKGGPPRIGKVGMAVARGDLLVTSATGKTIIALSDGSEMKLGAATRMHLKGTADAKPGTLGVNLLSGVLRASVTKKGPKGLFTVATRGATASIRGTDFMVEVRKESSFFYMNEGAIDVDGSGKQVRLEGQRMTANVVGRTPLLPVSLDDNPTLKTARDTLRGFTQTDIPADIAKLKHHKEVLARWHISYASLLMDEGRHYEAETTLLIARDLSKLDKVQSEIYSLIANIHARFLNDPQGALTRFEEIIDNYPQTQFYQPALFNAYLLAQELGMLDKSKQIAARYINAFPNGRYRHVLQSAINPIDAKPGLPTENRQFEQQNFIPDQQINTPSTNNPKRDITLPMDSPLMDSPLMDSPLMDSPLMDSPLMDSPPLEVIPNDEALPEESPPLAAPVMDSPSIESPVMESHSSLPTDADPPPDEEVGR
ncbi:MAG: FecR domain-containing protein [Magnetococcales bacterium]|nr:FecR domain-containing protein [Magnetococcales bacterium]